MIENQHDQKKQKPGSGSISGIPKLFKFSEPYPNMRVPVLMMPGA
jgi:hypothetical protein